MCMHMFVDMCINVCAKFHALLLSAAFRPSDDCRAMAHPPTASHRRKPDTAHGHESLSQKAVKAITRIKTERGRLLSWGGICPRNVTRSGSWIRFGTQASAMDMCWPCVGHTKMLGKLVGTVPICSAASMAMHDIEPI